MFCVFSDPQRLQRPPLGSGPTSPHGVRRTNPTRRCQSGAVLRVLQVIVVSVVPCRDLLRHEDAIRLIRPILPILPLLVGNAGLTRRPPCLAALSSVAPLPRAGS